MKIETCGYNLEDWTTARYTIVLNRMINRRIPIILYNISTRKLVSQTSLRCNQNHRDSINPQLFVALWFVQRSISLNLSLQIVTSSSTSNNETEKNSVNIQYRIIVVAQCEKPLSSLPKKPTTIMTFFYSPMTDRL